MKTTAQSSNTETRPVKQINLQEMMRVPFAFHDWNMFLMSQEVPY